MGKITITTMWVFHAFSSAFAFKVCKIETLIIKNTKYDGCKIWRFHNFVLEQEREGKTFLFFLDHTNNVHLAFVNILYISMHETISRGLFNHYHHKFLEEIIKCSAWTLVACLIKISVFVFVQLFFIFFLSFFFVCVFS